MGQLVVSRRRVLGAALLLLAAVAARLPLLGDPIAGVDEQFYLLVGDRMWAGDLPYVDIWDRKPLGLFLIYAACRAWPGDGVIAYQVAATLSLALTATVVAAITRRAAGRPAALTAGLATIAFSTLLGVGLGEAPIFYDLLLCGSAWLVLRAGDRDAAGCAGGAAVTGAAMLLAGIAITVKTTAIFEAMAFGLLVAGRAWGRERAWRRLAGWTALGGAPVAAIAAIYLLDGQFGAFWFANVVSILRHGGGVNDGTLVQLVASVLLLLPLALPALLAWPTAADRAVLGAWALAAGVGFLAIGMFSFHYALPLVAPLAVLAARGLPVRGAPVALALAGALTLGLAARPSPRARDEADLTHLLAALPPEVASQCLLVREGPAMLYLDSHACLASPYAFPGHFTALGEADALGASRASINAAALARRPAAIVDLASTAAVPGYVAGPPLTIRLYGTTRVGLIVKVRADLAGAIRSPA